MTSSSKTGKRSAPPSDGPSVIEFIEAFCRESIGERAGRPLKLQGWQRDLLVDLFEREPNGRRRYREALIGMARKNGKSSLSAGLALYLLLMDGEPGAQVFSCAGDKDQARIVFGTAKAMVEQDAELAEVLTVYKDAIEHRSSGSVYRVLSADAPTKEGLNPSGVVFDELHVQPNRDLYDVMTQGSGTRREPLLISITTAGYNLDGTICGEKYRYGKQVQSGEVVDRRFFFRWWEPSNPDCDYRDPRVWAEANPALKTAANPTGFLYPDDLEALVTKTPENVFRRYRLNQWTATAEAWLPFGAWDACKDPTVDLDPALPLYVGVDVALRNDSTAVVCAQRHGERTVIRAKVWQNPYPEADPRHGLWSLNIFEVETYLRELREQFPVPATTVDDEVMPGPEFNYDPAYFHRSAQVLEGDGLTMVTYPQHDSRMIAASQNLYQLVVEEKLAHDGDPVLAAHVANATADQKPRGWRLTKPKGSRKKIDAAIAAAIAVIRAQELPPESEQSVYEDRGLLIL